MSHLLFGHVLRDEHCCIFGTYCRENCDDKMDQFLKRCFYHSGLYNSEEDFAALDKKLKEKEVISYACAVDHIFSSPALIFPVGLFFQAGKLSNRLFYLSIPPNIFVDAVRCASLRASSEYGWTRVIVEKPFGRDSESSGELTRSFKQYLREDQIFRYELIARLDSRGSCFIILCSTFFLLNKSSLIFLGLQD